MNAQDLMEALDGRFGRAVCPVCEDRPHAHQAPSLSIRQGDRGILLHCFYGCAREDIVRVLRDRGLWKAPTQRETQYRNKGALAELIRWAHTVIALAESDEERGIQILDFRDKADLLRARRVTVAYPDVRPWLSYGLRSRRPPAFFPAVAAASFAAATPR